MAHIPRIYDVEYYISKGLSRKEAEEKVVLNKLSTSKGVRFSTTKSYLEAIGICCDPEKYMEIEEKMFSDKKFPSSRNSLHKTMLLYMETRPNLSYLEAMLELYDKVLARPEKRPLVTTSSIEAIFGKDSTAYKNKLEQNKKAANCSFEKFRESFDGNEEEAREAFRIKYGSFNLQHIMRKHGVDEAGAKVIIKERATKARNTFLSKPDEFKDAVNKSKALSEENFVKKYGEVGKQLYTEFLERKQGMGSLDFYIKKYGNEEGNRRFEEAHGNHNIYCKIEYWLSRGYSKEYGENQIRDFFNRRKNFSLDYCKEKYGENRGKEVWKARQDLWMKTLYSNTPEFIADMNSRKGITLENCIKKYGEKDGIIKFEEYLLRVKRGFSIEGSRFFIRLFKKLRRLGIVNSKNDVLFSTKTTNEYYLKEDGGKVKFYDFTIPQLRVMVEYNGVAFHPREGQTDWTHPYKNGQSYEEVIANDKYKLELANKRGFDLYYVWSDEDLNQKLDELAMIS